jgi:short-subunit dehydrogenase
MPTAIILGATSGIGKGLARLLVFNDYRVGISGRRAELLESLKAENPDVFVTKTIDITDTGTLSEKLEALATQLGGCDLFVISSGTGELNAGLNFAMEKSTIDTNIAGFTCAADWAFSFFEKQGSGHLVAITSVGGLRGSRHAPAYNASKAYQINYLEGLRQKAAKIRTPISITDVRPGLVNTDMAKGDGLFWVMPVDKVVSQIFAAIRHKKRVAIVTKRWVFAAAVYERM